MLRKAGRYRCLRLPRTMMGPRRFRTKFIWVGFIVITTLLLRSISNSSAPYAKSRLSWRDVSLGAHEVIALQALGVSPPSPNATPKRSSIAQTPGDASHAYAAQIPVEEEEEDADSDLDSYDITWSELENYVLSTKLGEGEYAEVFKAVDLRSSRPCVIKALKQPIPMRAVKREVKILQQLSGGPNIVQFMDAAIDSTNNTIAIVTEQLNNTYYRSLYSSFSDTEVRFYMFQLLRAIDHAHSNNVMHRDIKPHNLLIEHENQKLRLIDWGISDYYDENYTYTTFVGSRFWRAPEILVDYEWYDLSSDMWSFGCILAAIVFSSEPFFYGRYNNPNQLIKIAEVLGTEDLFNWLDKYEIELPEIYNNVTAWYEKRTWQQFVNKHNRQRAGEDAIDLVSKILIYDHKERISARDALSHPYFDTVREDALHHPNTVTTWLD